MRPHYIPVHYLSGFTRAPIPQIIWVYEKGRKEPFNTQLINVAVEKNIYPKDFEEYLAKEIEEPANSVLRKIRERKMISAENKIVLSKYMTVMLKRVPRRLQRFKEKAPQVIDKLKEEIDTKLTSIKNKYPLKADMIEKRRDEARKILARFKESPPREAWISAIRPEMTPKTVALISQMTWQFFVCEKPYAFLTCDNPVFFFESIGIGHVNSELSFPISSYIALWATWRRDLKEGFVIADRKLIHEINRRTTKIASRFIFFHEDQDWIMKLANKKEYQLHRII